MVDRKILQDKIQYILRCENLWDPSLASELPDKWEKHGNGVIFGPHIFRSSVWSDPVVKDRLFPVLCQLMKVDKIGRKVGSITPNDLYRRPQVELLYGNDGWVMKTENRIKYSWDMTKCMFSSGNISEKQRISSWNLEGQVVVDLYAGIGYFTLSYLVHAKASKVYACEWNPDAVEALERNLRLNKVEDRCVVLVGDNALTCPKDVADNVNLGLIPSSEASWTTACAALRKSVGGILHIHGNVDLKFLGKSDVKTYGSKYPLGWAVWLDQVVSKIKDIFRILYGDEWSVNVVDVVRVKSYGPCVDHLVTDVQCIPSSQ